MSLAMSKQEREAFLADVHVGVVSVADPGRGPLAVPVWYTYAPGGEVRFETGSTSRKAALISAAGRFSLTAQTESLPYKYVAVEGPVAGTEPATDDERRALAERYLGPELAVGYLQATAAETLGLVVIRMRPERWHTVDYAKMTL
jgi:nitroimidazol reductase NimA-like FMN-containing flavoprotein (pyridoxamine 5'-phosphate oxidase superfamily)